MFHDGRQCGAHWRRGSSCPQPSRFSGRTCAHHILTTQSPDIGVVTPSQSAQRRLGATHPRRMAPSEIHHGVKSRWHGSDASAPRSQGRTSPLLGLTRYCHVMPPPLNCHRSLQCNPSFMNKPTAGPQSAGGKGSSSSLRSMLAPPGPEVRRLFSAHTYSRISQSRLR